MGFWDIFKRKQDKPTNNKERYENKRSHGLDAIYVVDKTAENTGAKNTVQPVEPTHSQDTGNQMSGFTSKAAPCVILANLNKRCSALKRRTLVSVQEDDKGMVALSYSGCRGAVFDIQDGNSLLSILVSRGNTHEGAPEIHPLDDVYDYAIITPAYNGVVGDSTQIRLTNKNWSELSATEYKEIVAGLKKKNNPLAEVFETRLFYGESRDEMEVDKEKFTSRKEKEARKEVLRYQRKRAMRAADEQYMNSAVKDFVAVTR